MRQLSWHRGKGMDAYYIKPDDEDLKQAIDVYTVWFDEQLEAAENGLMVSQPISLAEK